LPVEEAQNPAVDASLGRDPAMRWIVGGKAIERLAASTSQMGRFETALPCQLGECRLRMSAYSQLRKLVADLQLKETRLS